MKRYLIRTEYSNQYQYYTLDADDLIELAKELEKTSGEGRKYLVAREKAMEKYIRRLR